MVENKKTKQTITLNTPCSVSDVENVLHMVASIGHWHNAEVRCEDDKIIIEFEYE